MALYSNNNPVRIGDYVKNEVKSVDFFADKPALLSTGLKGLDQLSILSPANLVVIASRPAMGKTALLASIVRHNVLREKAPAVVFSLELSKKQLVMRMLSMAARVPLQTIREGRASCEEKANLDAALSELARADLYIDDTSAISISEIHEKCRKLKNENNLGLVAIDYMQLINYNPYKQESGGAAADLRNMSDALDIPIIVASQLNRVCERRRDHRPRLSTDFGNSAALANAADVVIFLYREEYYNPDTENQSVCELIVAKNCNGRTGKVDVRFLRDCAAFEDNI
jgi:replicative DNA helicase